MESRILGNDDDWETVLTLEGSLESKGSWEDGFTSASIRRA
jgi:hypothetical protein